MSLLARPRFQSLLLVALVVAAVGAAPDHPTTPPAGSIDWADGAVCYEIYVRSFADSDGDGVGDFRGLTERLDYLNDGNPEGGYDLGVDAIALLPVFRPSLRHGHNAHDFEHVNPDYGTEADFDRLIGEAHRRGIKVLLDLAPAVDGVRAVHPSDELERVASRWLKRGVDGFRIDASGWPVEKGRDDKRGGKPSAKETHAALRAFAAHVRRVKSEALLVGESRTDTKGIAEYFGSTDSVPRGDELPCNLNFPLAAAIVEGIRTGDARSAATVLREMSQRYPDVAIDAPFLINGDMRRVATELGGRREKLRSAVVTLLTLPGFVTLYYGEEVGLRSGPGDDDRGNRTPMAWDASPGGGFTRGKPWRWFAPGQKETNVATQLKSPTSLLGRYRGLLRVRRGYAALRSGALELLNTGDRPTPILAFTRTHGSERMFVVHNLGGDAATAGPYRIDAKGFTPVIQDLGVGAPKMTSKGVTVLLPPNSSGVWKLD
jgi:glycosidase